MSTLQHTIQPAFRNRLALLVIAAAALAALTVTLIIATSGSSRIGSQASPQANAESQRAQRQLESVNGARYGLKAPVATSGISRVGPDDQLQAVSGARYRQPVGIHTSR